MKITEVRIKLMEDADDRLQAFCSITLDNAFVIRDLKIIHGINGPFVAMPSRKLTAHCPQCRYKNHLRAAYCNQCGLRLKDDLAIKNQEERCKLYADIAHPINSECRELIQQQVIDAFDRELKIAQQPGYVSRYDDDYYNLDVVDVEDVINEVDSTTHRTDQPESQRVKRHVEDLSDGSTGTPHLKNKRQATNVKQTDSNFDDGFGAGIF